MTDTDNVTKWQDCSEKKLLDILDVCPEVVAKMRERFGISIDSYDAVLFDYDMSFGVSPVNKKHSDEVAYFEYWYRIGNRMVSIPSRYKTKAKAQLDAVHDTMYELRNRITNCENTQI